MRHFKVRWLHDHPSEPVLLYAEVGDGGIEVRKVDTYADGHSDYAHRTAQSGSTFLSSEPYPSLDFINAQAEFVAEQITREEFETAWSSAVKVDEDISLPDLTDGAYRWIARLGEVLAIARYSRAAGARDYKLFGEPGAFGEWVAVLPPDTSVLVVADYDLPLRGAAADVVRMVPEESAVEWLVLAEGTGHEGRDESWECWGTAEVKMYLSECGSAAVVVGRMPAWNPAVAEEEAELLSAIVPRPDGSVHRGIY